MNSSMVAVIHNVQSIQSQDKLEEYSNQVKEVLGLKPQKGSPFVLTETLGRTGDRRRRVIDHYFLGDAMLLKDSAATVIQRLRNSIAGATVTRVEFEQALKLSVSSVVSKYYSSGEEVKLSETTITCPGLEHFHRRAGVIATRFVSNLQLRWFVTEQNSEQKLESGISSDGGSKPTMYNVKEGDHWVQHPSVSWPLVHVLVDSACVFPDKISVEFGAAAERRITLSIQKLRIASASHTDFETYVEEIELPFTLTCDDDAFEFSQHNITFNIERNALTFPLKVSMSFPDFKRELEIMSNCGV
jgi:hypothetical protein